MEAAVVGDGEAVGFGVDLEDEVFDRKRQILKGNELFFSGQENVVTVVAIVFG